MIGTFEGPQGSLDGSFFLGIYLRGKRVPSGYKFIDGE